MNIELADGETRFRVCKWQSRVPDKIIFRNIEALTAHVHDENNISLSLSLYWKSSCTRVSALHAIPPSIHVRSIEIRNEIRRTRRAEIISRLYFRSVDQGRDSFSFLAAIAGIERSSDD